VFDPVIILCALISGLVMRSLGQPALLGYLVAGFVLHELGAEPGPLLPLVAEIGVTLLLFTIGLKLQPAELLRTKVWGSTLLHMVATQLLFTVLLLLFGMALPELGLDLASISIIAFALTFSSTVFVIQVMQERGEMSSRHANLAIGILVIQDIAAVLFIGFSTGKAPQPEALLLLLLFPLRGVIVRLLSLCGHGELFTLFGLAMAIGGAEVFELLGIKGDLGALILGAILAGDQKAKELGKNLLHFKDLFLVGFFLTIGLSGWPAPELLALALGLGVIACLKTPLYFLLMTRFHAQPRTALLSSIALGNYSEFGLIVVAVAVAEGWLNYQWAATLSLAIAISFVISAPLNQRAHDYYRRWQARLNRYQSEQLRARRPQIEDARIFVLGMGNIGTGAYTAMCERHGDCVVGVDDNDRKLQEHDRCARRVVAADASDPDFWACVDFDHVELVMLALTNHEENKLVGKLLRSLGYNGAITAVVRFREEADQLEHGGISTFNLFAEAGSGFAAHADDQITQNRSNDLG
jgi:glutathione-regulated potassium-efflux system ancillary protein KefC